jgi:AbrB family looped-hinge helix DNA binding protein
MANAEIVTVSEKGQVVLPKGTRDSMGIGKGTRLLLIESEGKLTLSKADFLVKRGGNMRADEFLASEKSLAKDWSGKWDDDWDYI